MDIDEIMYRLYVLDKIRKGREAVEQDRFEYITHDSHHYAKKVTQEIVDKAGVLNDLPPHRPGGARSR